MSRKLCGESLPGAARPVSPRSAGGAGAWLVVLVAAGALVAGCGPGGGDEKAAEVGAAVGGAPTSGARAGGTVAAAATSAAALPALEPRIVRTASLSITVPTGRFEESIDRARTLATGLGGYVSSSSSSQGGGDRLVRGTFVLRVPADAYGRAVAALARLGRVRAREESGEDVTSRFVDLEARRRHLEAVEAQLLGFLKQTRTVAEALAVQNRLDDVQLQLEEARGRIRYLDDRTSLATITLDVAERGVPAAPPSTGGWGLADAWHDAVGGLEKVAAGAFVALVTAGPILAVLGLCLLGARAILRRRRARAAAGSAPTATPPA